jgi:hypothetical protein
MPRYVACNVRGQCATLRASRRLYVARHVGGHLSPSESMAWSSTTENVATEGLQPFVCPANCAECLQHSDLLKRALKWRTEREGERDMWTLQLRSSRRGVHLYYLCKQNLTALHCESSFVFSSI